MSYYAGTITLSGMSSTYGTISITSGSTSFSNWNGGITIGNPAYSYSYFPESELANLFYCITFSCKESKQLNDSILELKGDYLTFNCDTNDKGRIIPYELIMNMIHNKEKFNMEIEVGDILTIKYFGVIFKKIKNNLSFTSDGCDFSKLKVKIKYDNIKYENHKLHITEKRKDKLNKIMEI